ncbi:hypothetical protein VPH35_083059 [Triticum aestivum]
MLINLVDAVLQYPLSILKLTILKCVVVRSTVTVVRWKVPVARAASRGAARANPSRRRPRLSSPRRRRRRPASEAHLADGGGGLACVPCEEASGCGATAPLGVRRRGGCGMLGRRPQGTPAVAVPPRLQGQRGGRPWRLVATDLGHPTQIRFPPGGVGSGADRRPRAVVVARLGCSLFRRG